jgi:hypothetical protein
VDEATTKQCQNLPIPENMSQTSPLLGFTHYLGLEETATLPTRTFDFHFFSLPSISPSEYE